MSSKAFPNYTRIPSRLSISAWWSLRAASITAAVVVAFMLIVAEKQGLFVMWELVIPLLPILFLVAPGLWRNICPLAASNQTPRVLGMTRALTAPDWLKQYGYLIAIGLFVGFVISRKLGLDDAGPASALLLLGATSGAFAGGILLKGKSGWCSSICPLLPVQRIYGQTPFALVGNSHCQPCVGCTKSCYDFNPRAAYLADLNDDDRYWSGYRKLFVAAFPGLVLAFFEVPDSSAIGAGEMLGRIALYVAASIASFQLVDSLWKGATHKLTTLYGAAALNIFYWFALPALIESLSGADDAPDAVVWPLRVALAALTLVWVVRTFQNETAFHEQAQGPGAAGARAVSGAGGRSVIANRAARAADPEVEVVPEGKRVVARPGATLLEVAESNGMAIEAGCRMGVCGADPIAIVEGIENLSPVSDDERSTLDRLGLAESTRMACCCRVNGPVKMSLTPERPKRPRSSQIAGFDFDREIERVVVVGNGIAGVTAADHVRRRHPMCEIELIAEEPHHLYNRMGISRLIYGRSAMQGLYLNPDPWYEEQGITTWLNTRAQRIDRDARRVTLATGEDLSYDRLILATGSSSFVPPIEGYGAPGSYVLRSADDALGIRAFAQRHGCRRAAVAGGGLLGLEAAYALHKLGMRTTVLERSERLLARQLDARAAELLRSYLEGLGLEVELGAETSSVAANGRVTGVELADGGSLEADIFLVAAGIRPNAELAADAGIEVERGVVVDDRMRTSDPMVLACGDVAEHRGTVLGLWPTGVEQAEVAADAAVGGEKVYEGTIPVTILKVVGIELTSIGRIEPEPADEEIVLEEPEEQRYRKLVVSRGRIVGAILLGYSAEVSPVRTAINHGLDVSGSLEALRRGEWSVLERLSGGRLVPASAAHPAAG